MYILCLVSRVEIWSFDCEIGPNPPHMHRQVSGFGWLVKGMADGEGFSLLGFVDNSYSDNKQNLFFSKA